MNTNLRRQFPQVLGLSSVMFTALTVGVVDPATANPPNQSDVTGTNIFNNVAPGFLGTYGEILDPIVLAEAERLSTALADAYAACVESVEVVSAQPRRFAVRSSPDIGDTSTEICISPECVVYELLLEETQQFVSNVEDTIADEAQFYPDRLW